MTNDMINLTVNKTVLMNKIATLKQEIVDLKKNNPWYPVQGISAQLAGHTKRLRAIQRQIDEVKSRTIR